MNAAVIHQASLADLHCLAELWEVSSENLGLEITPDDQLVPKLITEDDNLTSLSQIQSLVDEVLPDANRNDIVVEFQGQKLGEGSSLRIATVERILSPLAGATQTKWWTFTDTYKDRMNS